MRGAAATAPVRESIEVEATIIRADGSVEELGRIAYWHRSPLKRFLGRLRVRRRMP